MLLNHLDRIHFLMPRPMLPILKWAAVYDRSSLVSRRVERAGAYFTDTWHPMISSWEHGANYANHGMDGIYYNGGSWMRIEICGYVAGKLHAWSKADQVIANRLWAELHVSADYPTSQEYLATQPRAPFLRISSRLRLERLRAASPRIGGFAGASRRSRLSFFLILRGHR